MGMAAVPEVRVRQVNDVPVCPSGRAFVLYWMIASRRPAWNFALDRAVAWARDLGLPVVVLEPLRADYRWKSDRFDDFVKAGMAENARRFAPTPIRYYPYVEPAPGDGKGLLAALAARAAVVVTDEYPCFFLPRMVDAAARSLDVRLEAIDSNGILPMAAADRIFTTAHSFRRFAQKTLPVHLAHAPAARIPSRGLAPAPALPTAIRTRWPAADLRVVSPGGSAAGRAVLRAFLDERLAGYAKDRDRPEDDGSSGLSPYLHFGHVSAHEVLDAIVRHEEWDAGHVASTADGKRSGWWNMSEPAEAFLDQLVTWRELGFNRCWLDPDGYDSFETLPDWALDTLARHEDDERAHVYTLADFEEARTHDELWNAAQRQLVREGRMHNYLRMLWGKKVLEWTRRPGDAAEILIELNNRYALDGRDPNSYSGIFWCFGRYDRAWGPERPVFGTVRYMSSRNTARKFPVKGYLERYRSF